MNCKSDYRWNDKTKFAIVRLGLFCNLWILCLMTVTPILMYLDRVDRRTIIIRIGDILIRTIIGILFIILALFTITLYYYIFFV